MKDFYSWMEDSLDDIIDRHQAPKVQAPKAMPTQAAPTPKAAPQVQADAPPPVTPMMHHAVVKKVFEIYFAREPGKLDHMKEDWEDTEEEIRERFMFEYYEHLRHQGYVQWALEDLRFPKGQENLWPNLFGLRNWDELKEKLPKADMGRGQFSRLIDTGIENREVSTLEVWYDENVTEDWNTTLAVTNKVREELGII